MKEVTVRGLTIGQGRPKICVPLMGKNKEALVAEAQASLVVPCDLVEWRVDYLTAVDHFSAVLAAAQALREALGNKPLLMTFRSAREGGVKHFSDEDYFALYEELIPTGLVDLVDLEVMMPEKQLSQTVSLAKAHDVAVVLCHHNFSETPPKATMLTYLELMEAKEADICKLAVMPQTPRDVLTLLAVTEEMSARGGRCPLVTISMGELGKLSRVAGEVFGSALTFGTLDEASAPGQLPVATLREALTVLQLTK